MKRIQFYSKREVNIKQVNKNNTCEVLSSTLITSPMGSLSGTWITSSMKDQEHFWSDKS